MNETFQIPDSSEIKTNEKSEWDSLEDNQEEVSWEDLASDFSDDDFMNKTQEIARKNTYDTEKPRVEKSEAEKEYDNREKGYIDELRAISDKKSRYLARIGEEYSDILKKFEDPRAKKIGDAFDGISAVTKKSDRKVFESLISFIDAKYPSPYKENEDNALNQFILEPENDDQKIEDKKDEYRRASMEKGGHLIDAAGNLVKVFTVDGDQNDYYIGNTIKNLVDGSADIETALSSAIIRYAEDPTYENRAKLGRVQGDREGLITNSLFNIADVFDRSRTRVGSKLFEPTAALAAQLVRNSEDYYDGIIDYLKFKIKNSKLGELSEEEKPKYVPMPSDDDKTLSGTIIS